MLEGIKEQRGSLFRYSFNTVIAVIEALLAVVTFMTFLQGLAAVYQVTAAVATLVALVILLFLRERIAPSGELTALRETLRLALHLDQILKQASEIMWLTGFLDKHPDNETVRDLAADNCTILRDSIDSAQKLEKQIGEEELDEALEDIHIDKAYLRRRLTLGRSVLEKCEALLSPKE